MKKELLLIGDATNTMMTRMNTLFSIKCLDEIGDVPNHKIEAIITNGHDGVPNKVMQSLPNLKIISCYGVGYDAIDVPLAKSLNIVVTHTPNVLNADVANTAIMLLLASSRSLIPYHHYITQGRWATEGNAPLTDSIEGKKIGILGMGRIGQCIAQKCEAFSMDIGYHSRTQKPRLSYRYYDDLIQMAHDVRYLVIITPGNTSTKHLVNAEVLEALGKDGTLINVARGSVVDETALINALQNGTIKAAALDVFANEPYVPDVLCKLDNVILQPHIASGTHETRQAMGDLTIDNIDAFFANGAAITPVPEMND